MSIVLINPDSPFLHKPKTMPPLGTVCVATYLKEKGYNVEFVDLAGDPQKKIPESEHYGIYSTTPQFPEVLDILKRLPEAKVCIGGPHASVRPEECLASGFDAAIEGEGEDGVVRFLEGERGHISSRLMEIEDLPLPDRSLIMDYEYEIDGEKATTMMTSRGNCIYNCAFCTKWWKNPMRFRSTNNVVKEIKQIKELGFKGVMFYDDEMLIWKQRDILIFEALAKMDMVWRCLTRANLVEINIAKKMSETNCREVFIGVESGSNTILANINKQTTKNMNSQAIRTFHHVGIPVKVGFIIGLPGDSNETLEETWTFCENHEQFINEFDFTLLIPYPGSPIYEHPEKYDISFDKNQVYTPFKGSEWQGAVSTSHLTKEEIMDWRNKFHKRFRGEIY